MFIFLDIFKKTLLYIWKAFLKLTSFGALKFSQVLAYSVMARQKKLC